MLEAQAVTTPAACPQITERDLGNDTRAIWIGGDLDYMLLYQPMRTVLRRSITEAIGYALEKTWTNDIVLPWMILETRRTHGSNTGITPH